MKATFFMLLCGLVFLFPGTPHVFAQSENAATTPRTALQIYEDSLLITADSMMSAPIPEDRLGATYRFIRQLKGALSVSGSYSYGFDSLAKIINIISPDDKAFRIFNWNVEANANVLRYYGAIQMADETSPKLYGLIDNSAQLQKGVMDSVLTGGKWFGALYYRIMPVDVNGQKAYTLFGLNGSNPLSNRKVLDVLRFGESGPIFGAPIFGVRSPDTKEQAVRFVLEYKKGIVAALNYSDEMKAVYFDRLESDANDPGRKYTYVPTGQYDGFRWVDGQWQLVQDLIPVTILKDGQQPVGGRD